ncbi:hypothetical protein [Paenibacillus alkalitolerans]|uniref:hypothetical protein n=1 Tax=Paenibacillus alkalitolerans TaxID=2799335 RepID=UPI0018F78212|nr:hypothetical protein [Paenibacillus alkalitolerans]
MRKHVTKKEARKWLGKSIYALKKDGSVISGKLVKINGNQLILHQPGNRKVSTKAFIPLVLFDLLAIGGHHGFGHPGFGFGHGFGHPGFGHGFGHPGFGFGHGFGHPFGGFF